MKIRLIGLGKMGANIALNLKDHGHIVYGFDLNKQAREKLSAEGIKVFSDFDGLLKDDGDRKIIWMLIPNQFVDQEIENITPFLNQGDIIIDAGNSNFNLSMKRYEALKIKGIDFIDLGTSGGTFGARNGACLMAGGEKEVVDYVEPVFIDVAVEDGYTYTGKPGSGHFVKMVHNGIEYGMMQAIAEGFDLLEASPFELDYQNITKMWNHGSIIESNLIGYIHEAFKKDAHLDEIAGRVDDSGEGMWTIEEALKYKVAMPVITQSLFSRYKSRDEDKFAEKVVAAMRKEFGGHAVYKKK
ncbi:decarboxylating 6-phosphogluconate dehydrogenase [Mycoplasmatota bacterium]|nr:decarboxylating 6-phosphogluconate dehydrogenase [Mycoplasmatota bacterium]